MFVNQWSSCDISLRQNIVTSEMEVSDRSLNCDQGVQGLVSMLNEASLKVNNFDVIAAGAVGVAVGAVAMRDIGKRAVVSLA
jgi:hypothetical protein